MPRMEQIRPARSRIGHSAAHVCAKREVRERTKGLIVDEQFAFRQRTKINVLCERRRGRRWPWGHTTGLVYYMEEMALTGQVAFPAERTLLTTGALAACGSRLRTFRSSTAPRQSRSSTEDRSCQTRTSRLGIQPRPRAIPCSIDSLGRRFCSARISRI